MEIHVFFIVLLAALFHATWNAFVKVEGDRVVFMAVLLTGSGIGALSATPFLPLPAPQSLPYMALSILIHQGYTFFLIVAYKYGDLSHVYPLARGSAPLFVAVVSIALLGEHLTNQALLGIFLLCAGIMSLSFTRGAQNLRNPWAVFYALCTGLFIAGYTVTDGMGARLAGNAHSYASWMLGLEWIPIVVYALWKRTPHTLPQVRRIWKPAIFLGLMSMAAFWAVIWAMTVAPISLVAATRETSIVFAVMIGVIFLKERLSLVKLTMMFTTLTGIVLLKFSRN